jgi:hypothetical protein
MELVGNVSNEEIVNDDVIVSDQGTQAEAEKNNCKEAEEGTQVGPNKKGKEVCGSKSNKNKGRPTKQQQKLNETMIEDEVSAKQINNNEQGGQSSMESDRRLSEDVEYNNGVLESGCESEDEDDGPKTKFSTFNMPDNMRDYKLEVGTCFVFKKEFQEGIRMYVIHSGRDLKFKKND